MEARYYGLLGCMFPYRPHLVEATVCSINPENMLGQQQGLNTQWLQLVNATVVISRDDSGIFFVSSTKCMNTSNIHTMSSFSRPTAFGQSLQFSKLPLVYCSMCRLSHVVLSPEQHNVTIISHPQKLPVADRRLLLRVHAEQLNNGCGTGYKVFHDQCGACFEDHSCSF